MAGYESYSDDGTLIARIRNGNGTPIRDNVIRAFSLEISPKKIDNTNSSLRDFKIIELTDREYLTSVDSQTREGPPRHDGSRDSNSSYETNLDILRPDRKTP